MDPFRRCVQDLEAINRLLELPHGHEIACLMFRELAPYLMQLVSMRDRDPTGAIACVFDYAVAVEERLGVKLETLAPHESRELHVTGRVA
jgi:hypothetical protein